MTSKQNKSIQSLELFSDHIVAKNDKEDSFVKDIINHPSQADFSCAGEKPYVQATQSLSCEKYEQW